MKTEPHHTCYISPKYILLQCLVQYILLSTRARCYKCLLILIEWCDNLWLPMLFTPRHACEIQTVEQLTSRTPAGRSPLSEWQAIAGFIVVRRRSTGLPAVTTGSPDDRFKVGHRSKIWSFEDKIGRRPNSLPAAIIRWPLGEFTTLFKVKKIGRGLTDLNLAIIAQKSESVLETSSESSCIGTSALPTKTC